MSISSKRPVAALMVALAALLLGATPVAAQGRPLVASLAGGTTGDADGSGYVWLELNQGQGTICYELAISGTGPVSNLRIFDLESGQSVVLLLNGVGTTSDCVDVEKATIRAINRSAGDYGVVVGTSQYPQGAVSGALTVPSAKALPTLPTPDDDDGPGNSDDAPGQNKPNEDPADRDNGAGNDDRPPSSGNAEDAPGNGNVDDDTRDNGKGDDDDDDDNDVNDDDDDGGPGNSDNNRGRGND
jgi:hypothetical protein